MKTKNVKRMVALLMSCIMLLAFSAMAYAAEPAVENFENNVEEVYNISRASTIVAANSSDTIDLGGISVADINKKLTIITASKASSGRINWKLKNGNVTIMSGSIGINDGQTYIPTLIPSNNYKLEVTNTANKSTTVHAFFE